jgi:hypothetical protein
MQPACSVLLNWDDYTGGTLDTGGAPADGGNDLGIDEGSDAANVGADRGGNDADVSADPIEASGQEDAGARSDADAGKPPCASQCGGCCDSNGNCLGGRSTSTCGKGGARCTDCAVGGQVCNAGLCSAPPAPDSGVSPMTCNRAVCFTQTLCIPVYQATCCKADQTCGCQVVIPPVPAPCN